MQIYTIVENVYFIVTFLADIFKRAKGRIRKATLIEYLIKIRG